MVCITHCNIELIANAIWVGVNIFNLCCSRYTESPQPSLLTAANPHISAPDILYSLVFLMLYGFFLKRKNNLCWCLLMTHLYPKIKHVPASRAPTLSARVSRITFSYGKKKAAISLHPTTVHYFVLITSGRESGSDAIIFVC